MADWLILNKELVWDLQDTFAVTARGRIKSHKISISELKVSSRTRLHVEKGIHFDRYGLNLAVVRTY